MHGEAGGIYNLLTSPLFSVNSRFVFLTAADSRPLHTIRQSLIAHSSTAATSSRFIPPITTSWSHDGSYLSDLSITVRIHSKQDSTTDIDDQLWASLIRLAEKFSSMDKKTNRVATNDAHDTNNDDDAESEYFEDIDIEVEEVKETVLSANAEENSDSRSVDENRIDAKINSVPVSVHAGDIASSSSAGFWRILIRPGRYESGLRVFLNSAELTLTNSDHSENDELMEKTIRSSDGSVSITFSRYWCRIDLNWISFRVVNADGFINLEDVRLYTNNVKNQINAWNNKISKKNTMNNNILPASSFSLPVVFDGLLGVSGWKTTSNGELLMAKEIDEYKIQSEEEEEDEEINEGAKKVHDDPLFSVQFNRNRFI